MLLLSHYSSSCIIAPHIVILHIVPFTMQLLSHCTLLVLLLFLHYSSCPIIPFTLLFPSHYVFQLPLFSCYYSSCHVTPLVLLFLHHRVFWVPISPNFVVILVLSLLLLSHCYSVSFS
jgi:hypothetical protein